MGMVKAGPYLAALAGAVLAATMAGCSQSNSSSTTTPVPRCPASTTTQALFL
jgi:hypothetical protein